MLTVIQAALAAAATLLAPAAAGAETVRDCAATKLRWSRALRQIDPARPDLAFAPGAGAGEERVANLADLRAGITCLEGAVSRVELREVAAPAGGASGLRAFLVAAASVLVAFDADLAPDQAADLVAALRAEAAPGRDAVSAWGPYEITYSVRAGEAAFVIDLPEN